MRLQSLLKYKQKRRATSPEPSFDSQEPTAESLHFVVHRHQATHLHFDFRLELDGVLKSWVVPKGPSMNPKDKRLALQVEDHPLAYQNFEGMIPEGNYGAGVVEIWDKGTYDAVGIPQRQRSETELQQQLQKGSLKFVLHGQKLKGEYALVKMKSKSDNAWLLIKHRDQEA
jgi:bifunctional non-homologous end joining protein LigD